LLHIDAGHQAATTAPLAYVAGLIVGLAIRQGELLSALRLSPFLVRILVRPLSAEPATMADLALADPEHHRTLQWLLDHQIVEDLGPSVPGSTQTSAQPSRESTPFTSPHLSASSSGTALDAMPTRRMRLRRRADPSTSSSAPAADANPLGLTFAVMTPASRSQDAACANEESHVLIPLVPGGEDLPVTDANKAEYVAAVVQHRLVVRHRQRLNAFYAGRQRRAGLYVWLRCGSWH